MSILFNTGHIEMSLPTLTGRLTPLKNIDFKIIKGEFISLIEHAGFEKSTLLTFISGLYQTKVQTKKADVITDKDLTQQASKGLVIYQSNSLLPWLTAYQNVELAVEQAFGKTLSKRVKKERVQYNLELVHINHVINKRPNEVSEDLKLRMGIARVLAMQPDVLLMDEPFATLDAITRSQMQDSLITIQNELNNTIVLLTHDVDEAVLLSDRIVIMTNEQCINEQSTIESAVIGECLEIDLERPRNRVSLSKDAHYNRLKSDVLMCLHGKQHKIIF